MDAKSAGDWYVRVAEAVRGELIKVLQAALPRPEIDQEAEKAAQEKAEREAKAKEAQEKAEREAKEKAAREAKEQEERDAQEKAEREAKERAEKEEAERKQKEEEEERKRKEEENKDKNDNVDDALDIERLVSVLLDSYKNYGSLSSIEDDDDLKNILKAHYRNNNPIDRNELKELVKKWYPESKSNARDDLRRKFETKTGATLRYSPNGATVQESAFTEFDQAALERLNIVCTPWLAESGAKEALLGEVRLIVAGTVTPAVKTLIGDTIGQWITQGKTDCKVDDVNVQVRAYDASGLRAVGDESDVELGVGDANASAK
ncbi:hypothetical protein WM23_00020 [Burkholderia ubonensis]|nr:hypothetical protein WM23_00020 [Burkholderia ubonensis]